jgi:hypothetical protein
MGKKTGFEILLSQGNRGGWMGNARLKANVRLGGNVPAG